MALAKTEVGRLAKLHHFTVGGEQTHAHHLDYIPTVLLYGPVRYVISGVSIQGEGSCPPLTICGYTFPFPQPMRKKSVVTFSNRVQHPKQTLFIRKGLEFLASPRCSDEDMSLPVFGIQPQADNPLLKVP